MDIMSFFGGGSKSNQQPNNTQSNNQQPANGNQNQGQGNQGQGGGAKNMHQEGNQNNQNQQPGNNNQNQNPNPNTGNQNQPNPLDAFSKMWDNPTTDGDKAPSFTLDPKMLGDVAGKQDFMQGLDPQLIERATSGDTKSLMELINGVGRNAYKMSLEHGSMLTDKFVGAREQYSEKGLPSKVRGELTQHALSNTPNYQHPVVKKQLIEIAERLQRQHPDASPQEIAEQAKSYFTELANAIKDPESNNTASKKNEPTNWETFFDEAEQS